MSGLVTGLPRLAATVTQEPFALPSAKEGRLLTKRFLKGEGDLGAVPDTLWAPWDQPVSTFMWSFRLGPYNLQGTFCMFSKHQLKRGDEQAGLFGLSENKKLFLLPRGFLVQAGVPNGKSHSLTKYSSKPAQPLSPTASRETLFLEVTPFNLQMSSALSPSWEEAANCSRSMNRGFRKVDYCPLGKWNTFPSPPPPCYCTLNCSQCSRCFKLQLLPARLPETWKSQACAPGEPDRKWHCAAFHGNHT